VLTNTFLLRSRWGVFSNLSSPGQCFASGVSSSCPSTAATTWYSSPRGVTTTTVSDSPGGGELYDSISPRQKRSTLVVPATLLVEGGGTLSAVAPERVDDAGTPPGDMSDIVLAPEAMAGVTSPRRVSPKRTDDAGTLAKDLLGVTLVPEMTVCSAPDTTSPSSNDQEVPSVFHPIPFRFSFDPPSDPPMVSAS
jgi:hypothetical protein